MKVEVFIEQGKTGEFWATAKGDGFIIADNGLTEKEVLAKIKQEMSTHLKMSPKLMEFIVKTKYLKK